MVETKVILCDLCKKQVATLKCALCDKDLCSGNCSSVYNIFFGSGGSNNYFQFYLCHNDCFDKVEKIIRNNGTKYPKVSENELYKQTKELFLKLVKKELILNNLEESKDKNGR